MMHQQLLAKLGMPLGELWRLGPLSRHMKSHRELGRLRQHQAAEHHRRNRITRQRHGSGLITLCLRLRRRPGPW